MTTSDNNSFTTVGDFLVWSTRSLTISNISTARLDSLILLEDVTQLDRARLLAHSEYTLNTLQQRKLRDYIEQRQLHTPLAYIRGKVMFYGRPFHVTRDTLIPRPETEDIITLSKSYLHGISDLSIADIGAGSGCIGITAALELPGISTGCYDISRAAISVAKKNAKSLGAVVHFYQEDLLENADRRQYDAILANLPYVPVGYEINKDATFEPHIALFAGPDGLDSYRTFWRQISLFERKPRYILTESEPEAQHKQQVELAKKAGYNLTETRGFIQLFKLC